MFTLAVDVMGGDLGPRVALRACRNLLRQRSDIRLIVAVTAVVAAEAGRLLGRSARVQLLICSDQVDMNDKPSRVLRGGLNSTMAAAINEVREQRAQAVLSVGNTGALMALSRHLLGTLPGIDRPALATLLPTRGKPLLMLDLGANLSVSSGQLVQFAALGWSWSRLQRGGNPSVGLLNVGREATKGTDCVRNADQQLRALLGDDYHGFCEGDDLYRGELDVLVTDGFAGNIVLKASEGLSEWLLELLQQEFRHHWLRRWLAPLWLLAIRRIEQRISPARHGGALLLGVNGVVIKTHGKSDARAFRHALRYVLQQLEQHNAAALSDSLQMLQSRLNSVNE
ncbi:phosphate acyltransferase PlsX [Venatoribacter cucullus]|nr:phosphate acyltransferase PlsX [Venatoribacter cucullus]